MKNIDYKKFINSVEEDLKYFHTRDLGYFPNMKQRECTKAHNNFYDKFAKINKFSHDGNAVFTQLNLEQIADLLEKDLKYYRLALGKNHPVKWVKKNDIWFPITCQGIRPKDNDLIINEIESCTNEYGKRKPGDKTLDYIERYIFSRTLDLDKHIDNRKRFGKKSRKRRVSY